MSRNILVAGGAGYIGSHVVVALAEAGFVPVVLDNFENSYPETVDRLGAVCGDKPECFTADLRDIEALRTVFRRRSFDAVINLAGRKAVSESVAHPMRYYDANVRGLLNLVDVIVETCDAPVIFSSSATVYGQVEAARLSEQAVLSPVTPYGRTKAIGEQILSDAVAAGLLPSAVNLRYFNPVGAHPSGLIGEDPRQPPQNLFPIMTEAACGASGPVVLFGEDYPTPDGTCIRDYIHVADLAEGHVAAVRYALGSGRRTCLPVNLGTGRGYSVREALDAFSRACGFTVPHRIGARRPGDLPRVVADPSLASDLFEWRAARGLETMCEDHWRHQRQARALSVA
jgi:UDP-glucose 4-epimerase